MVGWLQPKQRIGQFLPSTRLPNPNRRARFGTGVHFPQSTSIESNDVKKADQPANNPPHCDRWIGRLTPLLPQITNCLRMTPRPANFPIYLYSLCVPPCTTCDASPRIAQSCCVSRSAGNGELNSKTCLGVLNESTKRGKTFYKINNIWSLYLPLPNVPSWQ